MKVDVGDQHFHSTRTRIWIGRCRSRQLHYGVRFWMALQHTGIRPVTFGWDSSTGIESKARLQQQMTDDDDNDDAGALKSKGGIPSRPLNQTSN